MPIDFLVPFVTIGLAELLDKSQVSILLLSSRTKNYFQLFLGVLLAFLVIDGSAVIVGSYATSFLPEWIAKLIAAALFIIFGLLSLRESRKEKAKEVSPRNIFLTSFSMIAFAEFGDKSQIATAAFATKFEPVLVLLGVLSALTLLTLTTIAIGQTITKIISQKAIHKVSGVVFIALGILFLFV